jgi:hypothetical protein
MTTPNHHYWQNGRYRGQMARERTTRTPGSNASNVGASLFEQGMLIFSSARSETFVDQADPTEY